MNPTQLLAHFDRLTAAPDAIPRLRQFILELAVRGKLVERDPEDEPASKLIELIQAEKDRRIKEGQMKKQESLPQVRPEEAWFDIPQTWHWVRLGTITQILMGQSPPGDTYNKTGEGIPLINGPVEFTEGPFGKTVINQYTTAPTNLCEEGDLLLCVRGSTTGRTNIAGFQACIGRGVAAIRPFFADQYIRLFIWRLRASIIAMGRGIAFPSVSRQQILELPVPLPPLAEQHRIVVKVDELMALCDRLEAAQDKREKRRDRLAAASLQRLNLPPDPTTLELFRAHARFYLSHLPRLTTRPEQINALRQTILNLAIRGQLVPQNPKDEPASELLNQIQAEKTRLVKEEKIEKQKSLAPIQPDKALFKTPNSWKWVQLGELTTLITKGSSPKWQGIQYVPMGEGVLFITSENIGHYRLRKVDEPKYVEKRFNEMQSRAILQFGDILMTLVGASIGRTAVYDLHVEANINQAVALIRLVPSTPRISTPFLLHYFNSPFAIQFMVERGQGTRGEFRDS